MTNTVKYAASDTSVHVSVASDPGIVRITVEDTGPARTHVGRGGTGSGRGLAGMRERAALYRGEVTAGTNREGGWTVHALLMPDAPADAMEKRPD
ncbi:ATP-binding protein [Streptomyces sp. GTA36]